MELLLLMSHIFLELELELELSIGSDDRHTSRTQPPLRCMALLPTQVIICAELNINWGPPALHAAPKEVAGSYVTGVATLRRTAFGQQRRTNWRDVSLE